MTVTRGKRLTVNPNHLAPHSPYNPYSDLLASTRTCGHFQYNGIPCGYAIIAMQTYRDIASDQRRSTHEFVSYNLTREAFEATYAVPMLLVEVDGLHSRATMIAERPSSPHSR